MIMRYALDCVEHNSNRICDSSCDYPPKKACGNMGDDIVPKQYNHPPHGEIESDMQWFELTPENQRE
jgi:hypothetical protein